MSKVAETLEEFIQLAFWLPDWHTIKGEIHSSWKKEYDYSNLMSPKLRDKVIALIEEAS